MQLAYKLDKTREDSKQLDAMQIMMGRKVDYKNDYPSLLLLTQYRSGGMTKEEFYGGFA